MAPLACLSSPAGGLLRLAVACLVSSLCSRVYRAASCAWVEALLVARAPVAALSPGAAVLVYTCAVGTLSSLLQLVLKALLLCLCVWRAALGARAPVAALSPGAAVLVWRCAGERCRCCCCCLCFDHYYRGLRCAVLCLDRRGVLCVLWGRCSWRCPCRQLLVLVLSLHTQFLAAWLPHFHLLGPPGPFHSVSADAWAEWPAAQHLRFHRRCERDGCECATYTCPDCSRGSGRRGPRHARMPISSTRPRDRPAASPLFRNLGGHHAAAARARLLDGGRPAAAVPCREAVARRSAASAGRGHSGIAGWSLRREGERGGVPGGAGRIRFAGSGPRAAGDWLTRPGSRGR
jgi:hypothetical protein